MNEFFQEPNLDNRTGLERRVAILEGHNQIVVKELTQLSASYQHIAAAYDKMATRAEVETLRLIVNFIAAGAVAGIVGALFFRMISR